MSSEIYLLEDSGQLIDMKETPYLAEDFLQQVLAEHPKLLAGAQMTEADPRRWLLIKRPGIPLGDLFDYDTLDGSLSVDESFVGQIKAQ